MACDHGIFRATAYHYVDEVIGVLAAGPSKIGDITTAALVLTHLEHSPTHVNLVEITSVRRQ